MNEKGLRWAILAFLLTIFATIVIAIVAALLTHESGYGYWGPMGGMMGMRWIFLLIPLTFIFLIIVFVAFSLTRLSGWRGGPYCGP